MLVDTILKWYGHNPAAFVTNSDKWIDVSIDLLNTAYPFITALLALLPWIFYLIYRKKHVKNQKQFLWTVIKISVAGLLFGLFLPTLVIWISGGLAVRNIYGG